MRLVCTYEHVTDEEQPILAVRVNVLEHEDVGTCRNVKVKVKSKEGD